MISLDSRLKMLRKEKGFTTKQVASMIGVSQPSISYYENGQKIPSLQICGKLADLYGVSVDSLFEKQLPGSVGQLDAELLKMFEELPLQVKREALAYAAGRLAKREDPTSVEESSDE